MTRSEGFAVSFDFRGQEVRMFVRDPHDVIQGHHWNGSFYEIEELDIIAAYFPRGGHYVDIGANVGNHTVFVCRFLEPASARVIEVNPPAVEILRLNLHLNGLGKLVDMASLGLGLSDRSGFATAVVPHGNLGATYLQPVTDPAASDGLKLMAGDDLLFERQVDFIKMDVEGMEIRALAGLANTIRRWRPTMFIEVDAGNYAAFEAWLAANRYTSEQIFQRYPHNTNHLVVPLERVGLRVHR